MGTTLVLQKFFITSLAMWGFPITILYIFNKYIKPGTFLSHKWHTLFSGCLAVLAVNMVIIIYIVMAMKEPRSRSEPEPDPMFASKARSSFHTHPSGASLEDDKKVE